ncbi:MAG: acyltransferase domain-containing protein [Victivallaceae bacterium]|nr:acyltransferase domain-containing protein [Victivallaceae bacterium]
MKLSEVLKTIKIDKSYHNVLEPNWEISVDTVPVKPPAFLTENGIKATVENCQIDQVTAILLQEIAVVVLANPALTLFAWHFYKSLCEYPEGSMNFEKWPMLNNALGNNAGAFYLLSALGAVPIIQKKYRQLNIPEGIIKNTLLQFKAFNESYKIGYGDPGMEPARANWLRHYIECRLFRLGRMEYKFRETPDFIEVYQHKVDRSIVGLVGTKLNFDADGYVTRNSTEVVWTSAPVAATSTTIIGTQVSPSGFSLNLKKTLKRDEWSCVLREGDTVIDMHIPSGGGLSLKECGDSMRQAVDFFATHFPKVKTTAIYCASWIFNTQLKTIVPDSNLVEFMNELFLFPIDSEPDVGFYFVFCRKYGELKNPPKATRLQRGMLDILESGGRLRAGGMLFFKSDLNQFGSQIYLNDK